MLTKRKTIDFNKKPNLINPENEILFKLHNVTIFHNKTKKAFILSFDGYLDIIDGNDSVVFKVYSSVNKEVIDFISIPLIDVIDSNFLYKKYDDISISLFEILVRKMKNSENDFFNR